MIMMDQVGVWFVPQLVLLANQASGSQWFTHQGAAHQLHSLLKIPNFLVEFITPIVWVSSVQ
jgi:hypothetical protein